MRAVRIILIAALTLPGAVSRGHGADTSPPTTPTNLTATAISYSQVQLNWTASTDDVGVVGYMIYQGGNREGTSYINSFMDNWVQSATSFSYTVAACDAAGNCSPQSAPVVVTTPSGSGTLILTNVQPNQILPYGTTAVRVGAHSDVPASCMHADHPIDFVNWWTAPQTLLSTGDYEHYFDLYNLTQGGTTTHYLGCRGPGGQQVTETYQIRVAATPGEQTVWAQSNFDDGSLGPFAGGGNDLAVVDDPTFSGRGKVVSLHFVRIDNSRSTDANRSFTYEKPDGIGLGRTIFFKGDLYFGYPQTGTEPAQRKLLYFKPDKSNGWIWTYSNILDTYGYGATFYRAADSWYRFTPGRWYTVETQTTMNSSPTAQDGIIRLWVDGTLVYENTSSTWSDPTWPVTDWSTQRFRYFDVGDQMQGDIGQNYDEYRYWDNVSFTTSRAGTPVPSPDPIAPSVPSGLRSITIASSEVDLTWAASTDNVGVIGYKVYRNGLLVRPWARTSYADEGLNPSTAYTYSVSAYDAAGNESAKSTSLAVRTLALGASPVTTGPSGSAITVYPNPWRSDRHSGTGVTFANLPASSTLRIFTVSGHRVKTLSTAAGSATWDLTNDSGKKVASGLYAYLITADGTSDKATGKFAIIK